MTIESSSLTYYEPVVVFSCVGDQQDQQLCGFTFLPILQIYLVFTAKIVASQPRSFAWDFGLFCNTGYYSEIIPKLHY